MARLDASGVPSRIWQALCWALIFSAFSDVLIALTYIGGQPNLAGWLIAASSTAALLFLGMLSVSPVATGSADDENEPAKAEPNDAAVAEDSTIVERFNAYLEREQIHLDPNLTLTRLARRLGLPEKRLSAAVNRVTGNNFSRFVNAWRIRHACKMIDQGETITEAMLASGFNTKSNFNRKFRRVTGLAPSQWSQAEHAHQINDIALPKLDEKR